MDKQRLIDQLIDRLATSARVALTASEAVASEARDGATPAEKREDARAALEASSLGSAHDRRARRALAEIDELARLRSEAETPRGVICLGSLVEIEDADTGEGRTFFVSPVGAGVTLTGPGGDGVLSVVTPASPIGRAVVGRRVGDVADVTVDGDVREWTITWVA
jgi:transcription elongation GreA/GreB family factor